MIKKISIILTFILFNPNAWAAFPTTSVLDTFTRSNSATLGSNWTDLLGGWSINSNQAIMTNTVNVQAAGWTPGGVPAIFGPNAEVFATLSQRAGTSTDETNLALDFDYIHGDGYYLTLVRVVGGTDLVTIERRDPATPNYLIQFSQNVNVGDSFGMTRIGALMTAWYKPSGGQWTALGSYSDSVYMQSGVIGVVGFYTTTSGAFQNFGGGNSSSYTTITNATIAKGTIQ